MSILVGILPALFWGVTPIVTTKIGGKPVQQLTGTTYGTLMIALILVFIFHPVITANDFIWCFLAGVSWALGQFMQYYSFTKMDVSTAMPIFTGLQLIGTPIIGVLFLNEWASTNSKVIGTICIIALFIGIRFTSIQDKHDKKKTNARDRRNGMICLIFGSFGYILCDTLPRVPNATGLSGILPQAIGEVITALIVSLIIHPHHYGKFLTERDTVMNTACGWLSGSGTFSYLISSKLNGVATGFPLTQLNAVVATIGGIVFLHEHKSRREMLYTIIGLILIIISAFVIGHVK
ncbi:putative sugar uptake protein [Philodulcilactobacillus myokoensis]|uniref:Sugar uptake protein n=1 Tax=Philodulcilactobacillus myokoensis TaxID=2929573 RepID=A0A9W6ERI8_9LACO|nr:GRP family sugar transporter [Philodulcilactobacillus myokoensis]GLB46416.1 putative sugar uptake protein [Philodulcilactobacillus myokoensis]